LKTSTDLRKHKLVEYACILRNYVRYLLARGAWSRVIGGKKQLPVYKTLGHFFMNSHNLSLSDKVTSLAKRAGHGLLAAGITLSILVANIPHASAATTAPGARVSFTFDDGMTSALTQAAPTLQKYGFTGTSYVITGCVGMNTAPNECRANTEKTYMSWEQINQLKNNYGWEIGSHTVNHPRWPAATPKTSLTR